MITYISNDRVLLGCGAKKILWYPKFDLPVINKGVHEEALFDDFLVTNVLSDQVPVVIIGNHDTVCMRCQLDNVAVIVTDNPPATDSTGGSENQCLLLL